MTYRYAAERKLVAATREVTATIQSPIESGLRSATNDDHNHIETRRAFADRLGLDRG